MGATSVCRAFLIVLCFLLTCLPRPGYALDLLARYPTTLTAGDDDRGRARPWEFGEADIFRVLRFSLEVGKALRVETGPADLGIGHCADGAVWALLLPREGGKLVSEGTGKEEPVEHVWLRFHPGQLNRLFPPDTVPADGARGLVTRMRVTAHARIPSRWQIDEKTMIPEPREMVVDIDTQGGPRRYFEVDIEARKVDYIGAFLEPPLKLPPPITPALAEQAFDHIWEAFDEGYAMFPLRPEVDWARVKEQYRQRALQCRSAYELAGLFAEMLKPLRDLHVSLTVAGADVPVFDRPRAANANPRAYRTLLGRLRGSGPVAWVVLPERIGFLSIQEWGDPGIPARFDEALEQMRDTRALLVDVRLNGGGNELLAAKLAGRFLEKSFVYAYSQFRNGPKHTDLTAKAERKVMPRGPWRYDRPVLLLIGQKCMSSNESFIAMMSGAPNVTLIGDRTCGSSGNPRVVNLPLDMTVRVPQWIDYLPDGTPLDERGLQPQVPFTATQGAFEGKRDDLLSAAIEQLRQTPIPEKPIAGPAYLPEEAAGPAPLRRPPESLPDHSAAVKEEALDPARPKVVSVYPPEGAQDVPEVTELRVRFDRPMDPLALKLTWESGGFLRCEYPEYHPDTHEFTVRIRLAPGALQQVVVNQTGRLENVSAERALCPLDGFLSEGGRLAALFAWRFRTQARPVAANAKPPRVIAITPAAGGQVPYRVFVEVQFDQPMAPPDEACPYVASPERHRAPSIVPDIRYDAARHSFRIPMLLPPKEKVSFVLAGFRGASGAPAEPIRVEYQVTDQDASPEERERLAAAASNTQLWTTLELMRQERLRLTSLDETVQSVWLRHEDGIFTGIRSTRAVFRYQKPNLFYGDVSQVMGVTSAFRIGCDGRNWWWHMASDRGQELVVCPTAEMHNVHVSFCDPFSLTRRTAAAAATELSLRYAGIDRRGPAEYALFEAWEVQSPAAGLVFGGLNRWWVDPRSGRPAEAATLSPFAVVLTRYLYRSVNEPLPAEAFAVPQIDGVTPKPPEALDAGYTERFVTIRDGSDGSMSVRWGKHGPKGTSSSGLN